MKTTASAVQAGRATPAGASVISVSSGRAAISIASGAAIISALAWE